MRDVAGFHTRTVQQNKTSHVSECACVGVSVWLACCLVCKATFAIGGGLACPVWLSRCCGGGGHNHDVDDDLSSVSLVLLMFAEYVFELVVSVCVVLPVLMKIAVGCWLLMLSRS